MIGRRTDRKERNRPSSSANGGRTVVRGAKSGIAAAGIALAAALTAALAGAPDRALADGYSAAVDASALSDAALFDALLVNPDDPALNLAFAQRAEAAGQVRHALAAYERVLRANPDQSEAQDGFIRLRRQLSPDRTAAQVSSGFTYRSNPRQNPSALGTPDDLAFEGRYSLEDMRTVNDTRLKTIAEFAHRFQFEEDDLDAASVAAWTGPVFAVGTDASLHVAGGAGGWWLDDGFLYGELSARAVYRFVAMGGSQSLSLYAGRRFVLRDDPDLKSGVFVEAEGRFGYYDVMGGGDALYLRPRLRLSRADGPSDGPSPGVLLSPLPNFMTDVFDYGARVAYFAPVHGRSVYLGAGFGVYDRLFGDTISNGNVDRRDQYLETTAHLIFRNVMNQQFDVRVDYRFENNFSNDDFEDFENHVIGMRIIGRF